MDSGDYPDDADLAKITAWDFADVRGLFDFIHDLWNWGDDMWDEEPYADKFDAAPGTRISMSTGGWSGNESLIGALSENFLAWSMTWETSRRGGHYTFILKAAAPERKP